MAHSMSEDTAVLDGAALYQFPASFDDYANINDEVISDNALMLDRPSEPLDLQISPGPAVCDDATRAADLTKCGCTTAVESEKPLLEELWIERSRTMFETWLRPGSSGRLSSKAGQETKPQMPESFEE